VIDCNLCCVFSMMFKRSFYYSCSSNDDDDDDNTLMAKLTVKMLFCVCTACPSYKFQCGSGECIYQSYRCNHYCNCRDCSDERNCSKLQLTFVLLKLWWNREWRLSLFMVYFYGLWFIGVSGLLQRRRWSCRQRAALHLVTASSRWRLHVPVTLCIRRSERRPHCSRFAGLSRRRCSRQHLLTLHWQRVFVVINCVKCPCNIFM